MDDVTNIVFSNGALDPWSGGGVRHNISQSVIALNIPSGAHHLDLMFRFVDFVILLILALMSHCYSNDLDPSDVIEARAIEKLHIRRWISEKQAQQGV